MVIDAKNPHLRTEEIGCMILFSLSGLQMRIVFMMKLERTINVASSRQRVFETIRNVKW